MPRQSQTQGLLDLGSRLASIPKEFKRFFILLVWLAGIFPAQAAERAAVSIAAAGDLTFCLDELNAQFRKVHSNVTLTVTVGASGNFFAQIQRGAPFDVFLSADMNYPRELVRAGKADGKSLTRYAVGHIVLWTVKPHLVVTNGLGVLTNAGVRKIAIASPEHAPYGRAAKAALEKAGLWNALQSRIVIGENIAQTAQFVESGNVDAGIVALSLVSAPKLKGVGAWWPVPEELHPRLEQGAVLTRRAETNAAARVYLDFLRSDEARAVFNRFGFRLPSQ